MNVLVKESSMNRVRQAIVLASVLAMAGCGGGESTGSGLAEDTAETPVDYSGDEATQMKFDVGALGSGPLTVADLRPWIPGSPVGPPAVTPVVDTCSLLPAAEFNVVVDALSSEFSFGEEHSFEAIPVGAACDYRSETHRVRVVIGSADQVNTSLESPAMLLPPGAGEVNEAGFAEDGSISILSEDSFDLDTPFGAFVSAGSYGIFVNNLAGTGIDYGSTGALYGRVAAAVVASGVDGAPAPTAEALAQMGTVPGDLCLLWTPEEVDGFFVDESVTTENDLGRSNYCGWSSETATADLFVELLPMGEALGGSFEPLADGRPIYTNRNGVVVIMTDDFILKISASRSPDSVDDANLAIAENILARLG